MLHVRFPEWFPTNPSRLLGGREERPHCRAAEERNELAPLQLIEFRQVAAIGRLAAYRRAVTKSGLVQCRISAGPLSVVGLGRAKSQGQ